jgi:ATP-binding cassette subfamily B (MDR/TAP) protein 1
MPALSRISRRSTLTPRPCASTVDGGIYIDNKKISSLHLAQYRGVLALVSQEPTLYQGTIRDNILLGTDRDDIDDAAIVQACKDADIYEFVMSLP